jgi:hypothetical protein
LEIKQYQLVGHPRLPIITKEHRPLSTLAYHHQRTHSSIALACCTIIGGARAMALTGTTEASSVVNNLAVNFHYLVDQSVAMRGHISYLSSSNNIIINNKGRKVSMVGSSNTFFSSFTPHRTPNYPLMPLVS